MKFWAAGFVTAAVRNLVVRVKPYLDKWEAKWHDDGGKV